MRLLGLIVVLVILALGGLAGYAYLGDMKAAPKEMRLPVELDLGATEPAAEPAAAAPAQTTEGAAAAPEAPAPAASANAAAQTHDLD